MLKSRLLGAVGIVAVVGGIAVLAAQTPAGPAFAVASVKPNKSVDELVVLGSLLGGRFSATNAPLRALIRQAYQLQDTQIAGAPDWINNERFDVVAKVDGNVSPVPAGTVGPMQLMMQNLLADRFKLVTHRETKELQIYALVVVRGDGKLGPRLRPMTVDCAAIAAAHDPTAPPVMPAERPTCGTRIGLGTIAGGLPLSQFATTLSRFVQRVVVDRTGLAGMYDLDLTWDGSIQPIGPSPGAAPPPAIDPSGPSLFTAIQEQHGLKLESTTGPVDALVIDHIEMPTPD